MTWEPRRLSTLATYHNGRAFRPDDFSDVGLPVIRIQQLVDPSAELDYYDGPYDTEYFIDSGDLIFSWSATLAVQLWTRGPALLNQHLFKVVPFADVDRRWLAYAIHSFVPNMQGLMHGSAMTHITRDVLKQIRVPCPPPAVQQTIADFLDHETRRLDLLISQRRRMIRLLEERLSAIADYVLWSEPTKPLRHHVDEITVGIVVRPASWYVTAEAPGAVPAIRATDVQPFSIRDAELVHISAEGHRMHAKSRLQTDDVIVVRTGNAGAAALVPQELEGSNCISNVIIRCSGRLVPAYLGAVLNSPRAMQSIKSESVGAIQQHFGVEAARALHVPAIDVSEQLERVKTFTNVRQQTERLVTFISHQIALLRERRQALITATVTGQLEVKRAGR